MAQLTLLGGAAPGQAKARPRDPMDQDIIRDTPTLREWCALFRERKGKYPDASQQSAYLEEHPEQVPMRRYR